MTTSIHLMRYDRNNPDQCEDAARFLTESAEQPGNAGDPDRMRREAKGLRDRAAQLRNNQN